MISYSETNVFMPEHVYLFKEVQALVESFPDKDNEGRILRCHEVARAVAIAFNLTTIDGVYGCVEHSWCLIPRPQVPEVARIPPKGMESMADHLNVLKSSTIFGIGTHYPIILDPYTVGRLPQVQMVSVGTVLPHGRWYSERDPRTDIRDDALHWLCMSKFFPGKVGGRWVGESFFDKDGVKIV